MSAFAEPGADAFLDGTALPATLYLQWHIGNPGPAGTANVAAETTRQPFTRNAAAGGEADATADIDVASPAATEEWAYATLWGSSSGGVCWMVSQIIPAVEVSIGVPVNVDAADLIISSILWS